MLSLNTKWGYFNNAQNRETSANILLLPGNSSDIWIVKPQSFLIKPFLNCYSADMYTFERFYNLIVLTGFCEFSTVYCDFIVKKFWLEKFIGKMKDHNLSVCISTRVYKKALDYYCQMHTENYFLLVETRRTDDLIVIPFLDDEHVVYLYHLYSKTKCFKNEETNFQWIEKSNLAEFCFIVKYIYDRKVKVIDCKHYGEEATQVLKDRFFKYYENKFKTANTHFSYQSHILACTFYSKNKPSFWLVDSKSKNYFYLEIKHFDSSHTRYTSQTMLQILNTFDFKYSSKKSVFYVSSLFLIPFKRVLREYGFFVKRKCTSSIKGLKLEEKCVLEFSRELCCYKTESTFYLNKNLTDHECLRNPYIQNFASNGYVKEEDLVSFAFLAIFCDHVNVVVQVTKQRALQRFRDIDPILNDLCERVSATPFKELVSDSPFYRLEYAPLDLMNREINYRRAHEIDACEIVMDKYLALNGEFDEPAKCRRHKPLVLSRYELKRFINKDTVKQRKLKKQKALIFGKTKYKIREKKVPALKDEEYWLDKEKADANFKESLMDKDIEIRMYSSIMSETHMSMLSCSTPESFIEKQEKNLLTQETGKK